MTTRSVRKAHCKTWWALWQIPLNDGGGGSIGSVHLYTHTIYMIYIYYMICYLLVHDIYKVGKANENDLMMYSFFVRVYRVIFFHKCVGNHVRLYSPVGCEYGWTASTSCLVQVDRLKGEKWLYFPTHTHTALLSSLQKFSFSLSLQSLLRLSFSSPPPLFLP